MVAASLPTRLASLLGGSESLVVAACACLSVFACKEEHRRQLVHAGCLTILIATFDAPRASSASCGAVTRAMRAMCEDFPPAQTQLLDSGWMVALAAAMEGESADLLEGGLGVLRRLASDEKSCEEIIALDLPTLALRALNQTGPLVGVAKPSENPLWPRDATAPTDARREAVGLVGNLARHGGPSERLHLAHCGLLEALVRQLETIAAQLEGVHTERKLVKLILGALSNLTSGTPTLLDQLSSTALCATLLQTIRLAMGNVQLVEAALGLLSHLAPHALLGEQLIQGGAVEALLLVLSEHGSDRPATARALLAMRRLTHRRASALLAASSAALPCLAAALHRHAYDETVVRESAALLAVLCRGGGEGGLSKDQARFLGGTGAKALVQAVDLHRNDADTMLALSGLIACLPLEDLDAHHMLPPIIAALHSAIGA